MKTIKQLLRQPIKTLAGMLLMTLASATVCLCVGQALAAQTTKADLDRRFSTAAIPAIQEDLEGLDMISVEQDMIDWLENMAQNHPDIVKSAIRHGILTASIPQLQPYNRNAEYVSIETASNWVTITNDVLRDLYSYTNTANYDSAMMVITLEEIGQVYAPDYVPKEVKKPEIVDFPSGEEYNRGWVPYEQYMHHRQEMSRLWSRAQGYAVELVGTITHVLSLQDCLRSPEGMTARVFVILPSLEDIEALELEIGQQYIVYGMDYRDDYRDFVISMSGPYSSYKHISFEPFDPTLLKDPTQQQQESYAYLKHNYVVKMYNYVPLTPSQYHALNSVSLTVCLPSNLVGYEKAWVDGSVNGNKNGSNIYVAQNSIRYQTADGQTVTHTVEEYNSLYAVPTIAKLSGSVEDFLNSAEGAPWQAAIHRDEMNNHAFTVIGVEDINCLGAFAMGKAKMGEGRAFTQEEVETGAKVCIIHERIAELSGISIGDTITLNLYTTDHGQPYAKTRTDDKGLLTPAPSLYFSTTPVLETAEYTVVGFWQGSVTPNVTSNYYGFSGNTVFVPQSSVATPMEQCNTLPFVSAKLENGAIEQFHNMAMEVGYAGCFKYCDQDYSTIAVNFHNYTELAHQILTIGLVLYVVLTLMFLLLYPATKRKTIWTMQTLGCTYARRFTHVLLSAMAIVVPATVIGGFVGNAMWEEMVVALQTTAESTITLQMQQGTMEQLVLAQVALSLILNMFMAVLIAAPRDVSSRR